MDEIRSEINDTEETIEEIKEIHLKLLEPLPDSSFSLTFSFVVHFHFRFRFRQNSR